MNWVLLTVTYPMGELSMYCRNILEKYFTSVSYCMSETELSRGELWEGLSDWLCPSGYSQCMRKLSVLLVTFWGLSDFPISSTFPQVLFRWGFLQIDISAAKAQIETSVIAEIWKETHCVIKMLLCDSSVHATELYTYSQVKYLPLPPKVECLEDRMTSNNRLWLEWNVKA